MRLDSSVFRNNRSGWNLKLDKRHINKTFEQYFTMDGSYMQIWFTGSSSSFDILSTE